MPDDYADARLEIANDAAGDAPWFAPPDRKQFLAEAVVAAFASLLLDAFLAGFKETALKKIKDTGSKAFDLLWDGITDLFSDKPQSPAKNALQSEASAADDAGKHLSDADLDRVLTEVETHMKTSLTKKLRPADAARLAHRVRASVQKTMTKKRQKK